MKRLLSTYVTVILVLVGIILPVLNVSAREWDTITTYEYSEQKESQKMIEKYEKLFSSDNIHMIPMDSKVHLNDTIEYKQTTKYSDVMYLGDVKNGLPDGFGVILEKESYTGTYVPTYVGGFSKGYYDGYGVTYYSDGDMSYPRIEAHYSDGKYDGEYHEYMIYIHDASDYYISDTEIYANAKQDDDYGMIAYAYPLIGTRLAGEGKMKKGYMDGKWVIYSFDSNYNETYISAEVKFSNKGKKAKGKLYFEDGTVMYDGEMNGKLQKDGKGTLYREDGTVEFKGKFKNGDIKN